jgi:phage/plasmid-associated DNA primase
MWRRVLKVPFRHVIPIEERDSQVKKTLRDVSIAGPAILAWAVKGCGLYAEKGKLCVPEDVTKATTEYRNSMNTMKPFIDEKCIIKVGLMVTKRMLFNQYEGWCIDSGIDSETKISFGKRLKETYEITDDSIADNVSIWKGIGLKAFTVPE